MRIDVDEAELQARGGAVASAVRAVGPVDLGPVIRGVTQAMSGSGSARSVLVLDGLQAAVRTVLTDLQVDAVHLHLAAEQYASAERVVAAVAAAAAGPVGLADPAAEPR